VASALALASFRALALVATLLGEGGLWLLGYPTEVQPRIAHPPDFEAERVQLDYRYTFRTNSLGIRYRELPLSRESSAEYRFAVVGALVFEYDIHRTARGHELAAEVLEEWLLLEGPEALIERSP